MNCFSQLWLTTGTFQGHKFFEEELKQEVWKYHGTRASDGGRYGLLWWLFEREAGYVISGAGHSVSAVFPEVNVVVMVTRNYVGPIPGSFKY